MATFTITNLTSQEVHLRDFYATLAANQQLVLVDRTADELPGATGLQALVAAGSVSIAVTYSAAELSSGLLAPPNSVGAADLAEVAAADLMAPEITVRKTFTAGVTGTADDVTLIAAGSLPFKFRVLSAELLLPTAVALSTAKLRTRAGDMGVLLATFDSGTAGRIPMQDTATAVATPGTTEGIFLRRSDRAIAGEVVMRIRRES